MAVSKRLKEIKIRKINKGIRGTLEACFKYNDKKLRIVTLYSQDIKETFEDILEDIKEEEEEHLILGGDFNARTGSKGGPRTGDRKEEEERKSVDKVINKEGRILLEKLGERG